MCGSSDADTILLAAGSGALSPFKRGDKIAFLGDSITQMGCERPDGWVKRVERELTAKTGPLSFVEAGVSGNMSWQMAERFDTDVLAKKPDWLFFSCGVNDTPNEAAGNKGYPLADYKARLAEIFDKCDSARIQVICLGQTPVYEAENYKANELEADYNAALQAFAHSRGYRFIDTGAAFRTRYADKCDKTKRMYTEDGTHLNAIGHSVFAETVLSFFGITMKKDVVAFICAHPDDLNLNLGFCHLARDLYDFHLIDYTHGERGCGPEKFKSGWTRAKRTAEEEAVCASAGLKLHWLEEIDGEAYACRETCMKLADIFKEISPRALVGHWPVDLHTDHVMTGAAMLRAAFLADLKSEIWFSPQTYQTRSCIPDTVVDVSAVYDKVVASLRLYDCQNKDDFLVKHYDASARWYAMHSADYYDGYCEGYKSMMPLMQGDRSIFADLPRPGGYKPGFFFEGAR